MPRRPADQPPTTSLTLLGRIRRGDDTQAWREFDRRYRDLLIRYLRSRGLQTADAEDLSQVILTKLSTGLRSFKHNGTKGGFRAYLFRCTQSALADHFARRARDGQPVPLDNDAIAYETFDRELTHHHYRIAVTRFLESADSRSTAILEGTIAGKPAKLIGAAVGLSENAVHKAQQRLRERLRELVDEQVRDEELESQRPPE